MAEWTRIGLLIVATGCATARAGIVVDWMETRAETKVRYKANASAAWTEYTNSASAMSADSVSETTADSRWGDPAYRSFATQQLTGVNVAISEYSYPDHYDCEVTSTTTYHMRFFNDGVASIPLKVNFFIKFGEMLNAYPWNDPNKARAGVFESIETFRTAEAPYFLEKWAWIATAKWDRIIGTQAQEWVNDASGAGHPTYEVTGSRVTINGYLSFLQLADLQPGEVCELRVTLGSSVGGWGSTELRSALVDPFDLDGDGKNDSGGGSNENLNGAGFTIDGVTLPAPGTAAIALVGAAFAAGRPRRADIARA